MFAGAFNILCVLQTSNGHARLVSASRSVRHHVVRCRVFVGLCDLASYGARVVRVEPKNKFLQNNWRVLLKRSNGAMPSFCDSMVFDMPTVQSAAERRSAAVQQVLRIVTHTPISTAGERDNSEEEPPFGQRRLDTLSHSSGLKLCWYFAHAPYVGL